MLSCNKSGKKDETNPPPTATTTLSLNVTEATPGDAVEIKVNKNSLANEVTIAFGSTTLKGYVKGDSSYVFIVPVLSPGAVNVSVPSMAGSNTMSLRIASYTPVSDPQSIINDFIDKRNKCMDSIANPPSINGFQPSQATISLLNQLKEEMDLQLTKLSSSEKELLSYVMQKNKPDPVAFTQDVLAPSYYAKLSGMQGDVGDRLVAMAKSYVTVQGVCLSTIPIMVASGVALLVAPNPLAAAVFIGAFTTFIISRENAIRRAQEVGRLKGVAEVITDGDAQKLMTASFTNNQEKFLSMSVSFRNLASTDAGINADVATAFTSEQSFVSKDKEIESLYGKIKTGSWFTKLSAAYTAYTSVIGKVPQATTTLPIDGNNIVVKGVSDSRISFTTSLSGTSRKVKITSTATEVINFNLTVAYKRTLDGKEVTKDISCTFMVERDGVTVAGGPGGDWYSYIDYPKGFALDASGNIYASESQNCAVSKWAQGSRSKTIVAGIAGVCKGDPNSISSPQDVKFDGAGNMYVISVFGIIYKFAPGASPTGGSIVAGKCSSFYVDRQGNIYTTDSTSTVRKWTPGATAGVALISGQAASSVFVDGSGTIYLAQVDRVTKWAPGATTGVTVAGGNGWGAAANQFSGINGIYVDGTGSVYVADGYNNRVQKWTPGASSGVTVAGGNGQGNGTKQLTFPTAVFVDAQGYIYVADMYNLRIQKWPPY